MTKNYGMKKKRGHFKRHWKKYALAGAGLAGGGAGALSKTAIKQLSKFSGKARVKGWKKTSNFLARSRDRLANTRSWIGNLFKKKTG